MAADPAVEARVHHTRHTLVVDAPATQLYGLIADVTRWPAMFGPNVHVHHLERAAGTERFRMWALVNGTVTNWTSRRVLDPVGLRVRFDQEASTHPVTAMGGEWHLAERPGGRTEVILTHRFSVDGDDPESAAWLTRALDTNSEAELATLRELSEQPAAVDELLFSFEDSLRTSGRAADCYEFVHRADRWAERLPHVGRVVLREDEHGVQDLEMDTVTDDGSAHTTRSYRICEQDSWIAYKQLTPPSVLSGHSGLWTFTEEAGATTVTAQHTVAIKTSAIEALPGTDGTVAGAREFLRSALGANSLTTIRHAIAFAESR